MASAHGSFFNLPCNYARFFWNSSLLVMVFMLSDSSLSAKKFSSALNFLKSRKKILFLATSNRWFGEKGGEVPKSTRLALKLASLVGKEKTIVLDVPKLKIYNCEGNVSTARGNTCGEPGAKLPDASKNPSGQHRCWASINNPDDELWKISRELLASDCVVFFGSVRWGQMNSQYQRLIERLTWLENRHSCFGEENILKNISAGIIFFGQNWNGSEVLKTQKRVLAFFGFKVEPAICWNWQFTQDANDESNASYAAASGEFANFIEKPL